MSCHVLLGYVMRMRVGYYFPHPVFIVPSILSSKYFLVGLSVSFSHFKIKSYGKEILVMITNIIIIADFIYCNNDIVKINLPFYSIVE